MIAAGSWSLRARPVEAGNQDLHVTFLRKDIEILDDSLELGVMESTRESGGNTIGKIWVTADRNSSSVSLSSSERTRTKRGA